MRSDKVRGGRQMNRFDSQGGDSRVSLRGLIQSPARRWGEIPIEQELFAIESGYHCEPWTAIANSNWLPISRFTNNCDRQRLKKTLNPSSGAESCVPE